MDKAVVLSYSKNMYKTTVSTMYSIFGKSKEGCLASEARQLQCGYVRQPSLLGCPHIQHGRVRKKDAYSASNVHFVPGIAARVDFNVKQRINEWASK
jgi:hypothetical protein